MQVWKVDASNPDQLASQLEAAAAALRQGGLVAFPTETVYGLGANAKDEEAVRKVFAAKGRPADNPLIVHIADRGDLAGVVEDVQRLPANVFKAMDAFWPGPLTLILPARADIAPSVRPGMDAIGVRMPNHPVAQALLRLAGCPLAAPSANQSGRPSPTTAQDVLEDMADRIDGIVDGGPCEVGVESTVVAISETEATIYRPGGITQEQLAQVLGIPVHLDAHLQDPAQRPKSPGMKYRHYAPNAAVHVWWGDVGPVEDAVRKFLRDHREDKVAAIVPDPLRHLAMAAAASWVAPAGASYEQALSREIYQLLRRFDRQSVSHIVVVGVPPTGLGAAVMNRLQKAAEGRVHRV